MDQNSYTIETFENDLQEEMVVQELDEQELEQVSGGNAAAAAAASGGFFGGAAAAAAASGGFFW